MGVVLILVDGMGLGDQEPRRNPMAVARTRWFQCFRDRIPAVDGRLVIPTDASLGVPGLPQSATGQTALLTGVNAPLLVGRHIQGFCTPTLTSILAEHSLFRTLSLKGRRVTCANAFTSWTMERQRFPSVTTVALKSGGVRLRSLEDLQEGRAVYHDFTNRLLQIRGYPVPLLSPEEAAERLVEIAVSHDLTYYEHFQTDLAGHAQDMDRAVALLERLDAFLSHLTEGLDLTRHLLLLVSDHGNLEDLSTPGHTWNQVPTMIWGHGKETFASRIHALTDMVPALLKVLERNVAPLANFSKPE
jgi:hypothetical protein